RYSRCDSRYFLPEVHWPDGQLAASPLPQQQPRLRAPTSDEHIVLTVTVQIADRHAPGASDGRGRHDGCGRVFEATFAVVLICTHLQRLEARYRDRTDDQVRMTVVVEVDDGAAPRRERIGRHAVRGLIDETAATVVDEQARLRILLAAARIAREVQEQDVELAVGVGIEHVRLARMQLDR